jgi:predicted AlkP superfamily phosphohydrolase/phosphomutase
MNLKQLVNNKELWDNFVQYLNHTIAIHHSAMEQADDIHTLYKAQGSISALRRLKYLRDEMNGTE